METVYDSLTPVMDERMRRQWAAAEARAYGWGGIRPVSAAIGMSTNTVRRGLQELADRKAHPDVAVSERVRREGGGRKWKTEPDSILIAGVILPLFRNTKCFMGRKSRAKRERRAQRSAARRALLHTPANSETSEQVAYCPACGGITLGMQASGLYEGLIFGDLPHICPNCDHPTEIITWARLAWQSREGLVPPTPPTLPSV